MRTTSRLTPVLPAASKSASTNTVQALHVYVASGIAARFQSGAALCNHTATAGSETVACSSDIRFKKDVVDTGSALEWMHDMQIRDFTVKETGERKTGVLAQELLKTHPDMVRLDDRKFYTVDQPNPWRLVKAIQELKAANDNQISEIASLKAANDNLRSEIADLRRTVEGVRAAR